MTYLDRYRIAMELTAKFHGYVPPRAFLAAPVEPVIRKPVSPQPPRRPPPLVTTRKSYIFVGPYLIPGEVKRNVPIAVIQEAVARHYRLPRLEMVSERRAREVARPRQVSMYLSKLFSPRSMVQIGKLHGGRDHSTVLHAVRMVARLRGEDPALDRDVLTIVRTLG